MIIVVFDGEKTTELQGITHVTIYMDTLREVFNRNYCTTVQIKGQMNNPIQENVITVETK